MARRVKGAISRGTARNPSSPRVEVLPYPYPYISCVVPTFDCEGDYHASTVSPAELDTVCSLARTLREFNCVGTFCMLGSLLKAYAPTAPMLVGLHDLWCHGYTHTSLHCPPDIQRQEVSRALDALREFAGTANTGWRSPYGIVDASLYEVLADHDVTNGSNWGSSAWGGLPFWPVVDGHKYAVAELPFDDSHFDLLVFDRLGLDPSQATRLYLSRILAHRCRLEVYTLLAHPWVLSSDPTRVDAVVKVIEQARHTPGVWLASANQVLANFRVATEYRVSEMRTVQSKRGFRVMLNVDCPVRKARSSQAHLTLAIVGSSPLAALSGSPMNTVQHLPSGEHVACVPLPPENQPRTIAVDLVFG